MKDLKNYEEEIRDVDHDFKLAKRSVMVKNIPSYFSTKHSNSLITQVIKERYAKEFEGVTTLGRYKVMYKLLNERIDIASKLNKHMNRLIHNQNCIRTDKEKKQDKNNEQIIEDCQAQLKIKNVQIKREAELCLQHNEGIAFIIFKTPESAQNFIEDFGIFKSQIKIDTAMQKLKVDRWYLRIAPPSNDIIWKNISNRFKKWKFFKRLFTWAILIAISIVLITPLTFLENLNPIIDVIEDYVDDSGLVRTYYQYFMTPESYLKEDQGSAIMQRQGCGNNFFFFVLNQIMLPLTGLSTISSLFWLFASKQIEEWPELVASKMKFSGSFFLRYIIHLSLITNTFQLLSLPKLIYNYYLTHTWYFTKKKKDESLSLAELYKRSAIYANVESSSKIYFDVAYNQALSISIFAMIFLFSVSVPIILPFGALFFLIKYLIDKYNIVCVYPLEFESHGYLRQTVCVFMIISIWIFQLFFIGFFLSLKKNSFKAASFLIACTMVYGTYVIVSKRPWKPYVKNKTRNFEFERLSGRKVWNREKLCVEIVEDIPKIDPVLAKRHTRRISKNIMTCMKMCNKCKLADDLIQLKHINEQKNH